MESNLVLKRLEYGPFSSWGVGLTIDEFVAYKENTMDRALATYVKIRLGILEDSTIMKLTIYGLFPLKKKVGSRAPWEMWNHKKVLLPRRIQSLNHRDDFIYLRGYTEDPGSSYDCVGVILYQGKSVPHF